MSWVDWKWHAEIEPFPAAVMAHRHPNSRNLGDVTAIDWTKVDPVDLLVAGPPCQAFSVAGLRGGLSDHRGNLSLVYAKAIHAIDPLWCLTENVPGWLSSHDNAFGCFLAGLVGADDALAPFGFLGSTWPDAGVVTGPQRTAAWRVLDAQWQGLAQRRRRVFVCSIRGARNWRCAEALFPIGKSVLRDSPPSRETGARVAASLTRGADSGGRGGYARRRREGDVNIIAGALDSAQGGPDDNTAQANHLICMAHGQASAEIGEDQCPTLAKGSHAPAIAFQERGRPEGRTVESQDDLAYSMNAPSGGGRRQESNVAGAFGVRRLTPRECERLQGFPDDFSAITFKGKPAADAPRYRALGNSMAVPVVRWIGRRIQAVDAIGGAA